MNPPEPVDIRRPSPHEVVISFAPLADSPLFSGHYPGQPILAGVTQIDWAMRLAQRCLGVEQRAASDFRVKFRRVIQPQDPISMTLQLDPARGDLTFEYRIGDDLASSGRIRLERSA